jgi:hypothetical protein
VASHCVSESCRPAGRVDVLFKAHVSFPWLQHASARTVIVKPESFFVFSCARRRLINEVSSVTVLADTTPMSLRVIS